MQSPSYFVSMMWTVTDYRRQSISEQFARVVQEIQHVLKVWAEFRSLPTHRKCGDAIVIVRLSTAKA